MTDDADEIRRLRARAHEDAELIASLRRDAGVHEAALLAVRDQLAAAEDELGDLRAIRDALTPSALPDRPGLVLSVSFQAALNPRERRLLPRRRRPTGHHHDRRRRRRGQGIDAARDAAFLRTAFAASAEFTSDPSQLLRWTNVAFAARVSDTPRFATVACLTFDPSSRTLRFALAGHPPPIWLHSGDELDGSHRGIPLGINANIESESAHIELDAGQGMLLYTDGLTESRQGTELFGSARVSELIREHRHRPTSDLLDTLRLAATDFSGGKLNDDMCLVSVCAT